MVLSGHMLMGINLLTIKNILNNLYVRMFMFYPYNIENNKNIKKAGSHVLYRI